MKILLSDLHLAPFRREKFLTQKKNFIELIIDYFARKFENKDREEKMLDNMHRIIEQEGISVGYFNGDFMEARRTERGMNTSEDIFMARQLQTVVLKKLGLKRGEFNLGNHESGYNLPLGTDQERGINWSAMENFLIFTQREDMYHSFFEDGYRIIFIPYVFSEEKARDFDLAEEKRNFLAKMQQDLAKEEQIILFVHDPDSFDDAKLLQIIRKNRDKIKLIFFGHYHAWINLLFMRILVRIYSLPWLILARWITSFIFFLLAKGDRNIVRELGKYFRKRKNIPAIIKELGAILTPAPSGTLGIGGGFLIADLKEDGIEIRKIKTSKLEK